MIKKYKIELIFILILALIILPISGRGNSKLNNITGTMYSGNKVYLTAENGNKYLVGRNNKLAVKLKRIDEIGGGFKEVSYEEFVSDIQTSAIKASNSGRVLVYAKVLGNPINTMQYEIEDLGDKVLLKVHGYSGDLYYNYETNEMSKSIKKGFTKLDKKDNSTHSIDCTPESKSGVFGGLVNNMKLFSESTSILTLED